MRESKLDLVASYGGAAWSAVMSIAFVPLYVRYLGIESYGLIGLFATLQAWMAMLDLGITPTVTREMARFRGGSYRDQGIGDLLISLEKVYLVVVVVAGALATLTADFLATNWLKADNLSSEAISHALMVMSWAIAFRWMSGLYRGALLGLQQFLWLNTVVVFFSTMRGLGVVFVLAWLSPTIEAFFIFQGVVSALELLIISIHTWKLLPGSWHPL